MAKKKAKQQARPYGPTARVKLGYQSAVVSFTFPDGRTANVMAFFSVYDEEGRETQPSISMHDCSPGIMISTPRNLPLYGGLTVESES